MPTADFSEFSYGYAVVREAENLMSALGMRLTTAPTLPSLIKENTVGYDAHLTTVDFALFLQFKRSFFVSRRHAAGPCGYPHGEPHCTWAYWKTQHYRFSIDTESNQFHAMRGYEADIVHGYRAGLSLYSAPAFHEQEELNDHYLHGRILSRSVALRPSAFDTADSGFHQFSFDAAVGTGVVTSEPVAVNPSPLSAAIEANAEAALREPGGETLTLATLAQWASAQAAAFGLPLDVDRQSASGALALLNDFASLLGGAFVLLGRPSLAEDQAPRAGDESD